MINVVTYPDVVYDNSRKFLMLEIHNIDLQVFVDAVAAIDDPEDYTVYQRPYGYTTISEEEWILNMALQSEKIHINLYQTMPSNILSSFLLAWKNSYWSYPACNKDQKEFLIKLNPRYVASPVDLLVNTIMDGGVWDNE